MGWKFSTLIQDFSIAPVLPGVQALTGVFAEIAKLVPEGDKWQALDDQGNFLLHLTANGAAKLRDDYGVPMDIWTEAAL
jgi:hypothetical protein